MSLVSFAVHPDALAPSGDPREQLDHRRALNAWHKFGVLLRDADAGQGTDIAGAVLALPQQVRKLWEEALLREPHVISAKLWDWLCHTDRVQAGAPCVACLSEPQAVGLGLRPQDPSTGPLGCGVEVTLLRFLDMTETFRRAEEAAGEDIQSGSDRNEVWSNRFAPLLRFQNMLTIVDRFSLKNLRDKGQRSGAGFFLRSLSGMATKKLHVTWVCSRFGFPTVEFLAQCRRSIADAWGRGPEAEFEVILMDDDVALEEIHDRYVRCGTSHVLNVGGGLDILQANPIRVTSRCILAWDGRERRGQEFRWRRMGRGVTSGRFTLPGRV